MNSFMSNCFWNKPLQKIMISSFTKKACLLNTTIKKNSYSDSYTSYKCNISVDAIYIKQNKNKLAGPEYIILQLGRINCQFTRVFTKHSLQRTLLQELFCISFPRPTNIFFTLISRLFSSEIYVWKRAL